MVSRGCLECLVCGQTFVVRVGIGLEETCTHTFDCPNCFTPITVDAKIGPPAQVWIDYKENCKAAKEDAQVKGVVNLHPSIAFRASEYHSQYAFPSMLLTHLAGPYMRVPAGARARDVAQHFELPHTKQLWAIVDSVIRLHLQGDPAGVLQKQLAKYVEKRREFSPTFTCSTVFKCVASFLDDVFFPAIGNLRHPLRDLVHHLRSTHPDRLKEFDAYYRSELEKPNLGAYLAVFQDYFANFDQFRQLLVFARVGNEEVDDLIVGAKKFNDVKLFYGQAYETLTSAYVTLACLNNIKQNRSFDSFASMSLNKYIKDVEKAKRSNPFAAEPVLAAFTKWDDSALRNGSHHAAIGREGELVKYRSGGTGAEREIAYSRYVHICNGITIALAALMLVELQEFSSLSGR
jgi:hypothetical protein